MIVGIYPDFNGNHSRIIALIIMLTADWFWKIYFKKSRDCCFIPKLLQKMFLNMNGSWLLLHAVSVSTQMTYVFVLVAFYIGLIMLINFSDVESVSHFLDKFNMAMIYFLQFAVFVSSLLSRILAYDSSVIFLSWLWQSFIHSDTCHQYMNR